MKKKLISKTFLKDVEKYKLQIFYNFDDYYLAIKKIIKIKEPFISTTDFCLIDNNYYIAEVIPKGEKYTMRIFFNNKKERLLYYFDITLENGLDKETKIPFYDDLYLDVVLRNDDSIEVLDENELLDALNQKNITKAQYDLAISSIVSLIESIKNKSNKYIKLDIENYLD